MARIYVLIDPRTSEIRYVGQTTRSLSDRLRGHVRCAGDANHREVWITKLQRMNLKPRIELVQEIPDQFADEVECYWIAHYRGAGCDLTNTGVGGKSSGMTGRKHAPESRKKISASHVGIRPSLESRRKMSISARARGGHPQTYETRMAISATRLARVGRK